MSAFTDNLKALQTQLEKLRANLEQQIRPLEFAAGTLGSGPIDRHLRDAAALLAERILMTAP